MYIIFLVLFYILEAKLTIISPPELKKQFVSKIKYSIANFGIIPWNTQKVGILDIANINDGCLEIDQTIIAKFILIERGNCTFVTKVKNAQNAGYELVIISDTEQQEIENDFIMADDGKGFQITIPSIIIGKKSANIFKEFITKQNIDIMLLIKFELKKKDNLKVLFAIDLLHEPSLKLIRDFSYYHSILNTSQINYEFLYPIYTSQIKDDMNCLNEGRYCSNAIQNDDFGTGQDVIEEIIRQQCIFQLNQTLFFHYVSQYSLLCYYNEEIDLCSQSIIASLKISQQDIENCQKSSFISQNVNTKIENYNIILENQISLIQQTNIQAFPQVIIDHHLTQQNITGIALFNRICSSLLNPPNGCQQKNQSMSTIQQQDLQYLMIIILIIFVLLLFIVYLTQVLCRQQQQKQQNEQISELVTQYIKFIDKNNQDRLNSSKS